MKQLSPLRLAFVFAGCFLGAGYVSGQEMWQFFGTYGLGGYFGIVFAIFLLFAFGVLTLRISQITGETEMDRMVIPWRVPFLRKVLGVLNVVFLFGVDAIMAAGIGALLEQLFGIPHLVGSLVFSLLVLAVAAFGLQGVVSAFSFSVPLLVLVTLTFGVISVWQNDFTSVVWEVKSGDNGMLGNWVAGAVNFACYNIFGAIGLMVPFAGFIPSKKTVFRGVGLGAVGLLLIAVSVLLCMTFTPASVEAELPMLVLAGQFGTFASYLYALLLTLAMFGTSLSSLVSMMDFLARKFRAVQQRQILWLSAFTALAFLASLYGFGDLIGVIYPIFGYCSAIFLVLMLVQYFQLKKAGLTKIR